jgi:hypothetical protein
MHEQDIGLPTGAEVDGLPGTDRHGLHAALARVLEGRHQRVQEARVACARRRGQDHLA